MTRYHALVLVPGGVDTPEEETCEATARLLYPFMRSEDDPGGDHEFDWSSSRTISRNRTVASS